jgi:hypothetical protein
MIRFYPHLPHAVCTLVLAASFGASSAAQTPAPSASPPERPRLGTEIPLEALTYLPASSNLYSILETIQADLISDRLDTGGLGLAQPARVGAHGSTWTQTQFRIGDVGITDPTGSGTPLFMPGILPWERIDVNTGLMPLDVNAPGLAITLTPRRPSESWTRSVEGFFAPSGLQAGRTVRTPPAIERIDAWQDGSLLVSGPLIANRLGIVLAANVGQVTRFERRDLTPYDSSIASGFAHVVFTPNARDEVRLVAMGQRTTYPFAHHNAFAQPGASERDVSAGGQLTWERRVSDGLSWRMFVGGVARQQTPQLLPTNMLVMDRLRQGPVGELLSPGQGMQQIGTIGVHLTPAAFDTFGRHHMPQAGVTGSLGHASSAPSFNGRIGELVDGQPARVWDFTSTGLKSQWHSTSFAAYAGDRIQLLRSVTAEVGLRFESITGSAEGAVNGVAWQDLFPRGTLRWDITNMLGLSAFAGYGRYGYQLPLGWLAYGDPNAATGTVYRWTRARSAAAPASVGPGEVGALIARVGPGTAGRDAFSTIDPVLKRPYMDEVTFGLESRPRPRTVMRLTATARRDRQLVGLLEVGVPASTYTVVQVADQGFDGTFRPLQAFNRSPATFGADRYVLSNPSKDENTFVGVDISGQTQTDNLFFLFGATAGRSEGWSGNRGFQPTENDYGVIGEVFTNPNAKMFAQGRNFTERGYTIKTAAVYRFPGDIHLGLAARYQDGEHFSRYVIFQGLNQGPEPVRAFRNGRTRFTFTMTVDGRLQKGFVIGGHRIEAILDAYNMLNQDLQVEEHDVTSPTWRWTTAVQPPRVVHVGLRIHF